MEFVAENLDSDRVVDCVVVGSGLAGLSCARQLALQGRRVMVLEKAATLGGHLNPFARSGATFEVGLHYIADTQAGSRFAAACASLGLSPDYVALDDAFEEVRLRGRPVFEHRKPFPEFLESLCRKWPQHRRAFETYGRDAELLWEFANRCPFPVEMGSALSEAVSMGVAGTRILRLATLTTRDYFFGNLGLPLEICELLWVQHLLMGVEPSRLALLPFLLMHRYYFNGACFIRGGGGALRRQLLHPDVTYVTKAPVRLERQPSSASERWAAVLPKAKIRADHVVWTPDPRLLQEHSPASLSGFERWRLSRVQYPHALAVGYFATKRPLEELGLANRNYWLLGELSADESYADTSPELLARGGLLYVSTGSLRDPEAISPGNALGAAGVFQAMFVVPPRLEPWGISPGEIDEAARQRYEKMKKSVLESMTSRLCRQLQLPPTEIVWKELGTPLTHARYLNSLGFNGYGYAATVGDLLAWRPGWKAKAPGLYFCGAHLRPSHGIVTALVNGVEVGRRVGELMGARERTPAGPEVALAGT